MLHQYPRLSRLMPLHTPRAYAWPNREFFAPFERPLFYTPRVALRPFPEASDDIASDEEREESEVPVRHSRGPVRIPITYGRSTISRYESFPQAQARGAGVRATHTLSPAIARMSMPGHTHETTPQSNEDIAKREKGRMRSRLELYGLVEREVKGDGNCQFRALANQLTGKEDDHVRVRKVIVDWLRNNAEYKIDENTCLKDFLHQDRFPTWDDYCDIMSADSVWGDHITLIAASEQFKAKIWILSSIDLPENSKMSPVTIIEPRGLETEKSLFLGHWHERHYSSLVPEDQLNASH